MSTKELIKIELDSLDDTALQSVYAFIKQLEKAANHTAQTSNSGPSGLCGIWSDDRSAEEVIADIADARSRGRDVEL